MDSEKIKPIYVWVLSSLLTILSSTIITYAYKDSYTIQSLQTDEAPLDLSANRYLYTGDWPASGTEQKLISNHDFYKIINKKEIKGNEKKSKSK